MKISLLGFSFCILLTMACTNKKKHIIFFGDSITEVAVNRGGYIARMDSMLAQQKKADQFELTGAGVSGNKVYDLFLRMDDDVLAKNPDLVVIFIGVNDVWHKRTSGTGTDADKFVKFYQAIIQKLKANNIEMILCTPAVIGEKTDFTNPLDGEMNEYSKIIRDLAGKNNFALVDLRKIFREYNLTNNPENRTSGILTTDGVHLNAKGNQLVAEEMWKVIQIN